MMDLIARMIKRDPGIVKENERWWNLLAMTEINWSMNINQNRSDYGPKISSKGFQFIGNST